MRVDMHQNHKAGAAEARAKVSVAPQPSLSEHYKPVGIQAVTAATVCKAPAPKPKKPGPLPEDS